MPYTGPEKLPLEDEELEGVEGEAIEIDPIEIVGDVPADEPDWIGREEEPLSWRIAEGLEALYPDFDNGSLPISLGKGLGEVSLQPEAALTGMTDAATFGHADELAGAARAALSDETYAEARDDARGRRDRVQEASPGSTTFGNLLGVAATAPMLVNPIIAAESGLGRLGAAAGEGVLLGALGGEGASEGDLGSEQWAEDTVRGGAAGGALGLAGGVVGEGVRAAVPAVQRQLARRSEEAGGLLGSLIGRREPPTDLAELGAQSARALDEIADEIGEGIADVSAATRRAERMARRQREGGAAVAPWLDELEALSGRERDGIRSRLAQLAGSGSEGAAARQALRRARTGQPVNFGELEAVRRRLADAILDSPSPALRRLHDDIADALQGVAESQGRGAQYFDAVQGAQQAALGSRRGGGLVSDTLAGAVGGAAVDAGSDLLAGRDVDVDITGPLIGAAGGALGNRASVRRGAMRATRAGLEGLGRVADVAPRLGAGLAGQAAAVEGESGDGMVEMEVTPEELAELEAMEGDDGLVEMDVTPEELEALENME